MASPLTFENTLRVHDQAVVNWLGGMTVDYGSGNDIFTYDTPKLNVPIIVVFATPDRAAATLLNQLLSMNWLGQDEFDRIATEGARIEQMPLPFVSLTRGTPQLDPDLRGVPKYLRSPPDQIDVRTGQPYIYQFPAHYRTPYTATFWAARQYTYAFVLEWLMGQLGPLGCHDDELLIPVVHNDPFGTVNQSLKFVGMADRSDLEGTAQRNMRFDAEFTLRTWVIKAPVTNWGGQT